MEGTAPSSDWKIKALVLSCTFSAIAVMDFLFSLYIPLILQAGNPAFANSKENKDALVRGKTFAFSASLTFFIVSWVAIFGATISPLCAHYSEGIWFERFGGRRKPFLVLGICVSTFSFMLLGVVESIAAFLVCIGVHSFGIAVARPMQHMYVAEQFAREVRSPTQGISATIQLIWTGIAAIVGGAIYQQGGQQLLFSSFALWAFGISLVTIIFIREKKMLENNHGDDADNGMNDINNSGNNNNNNNNSRGHHHTYQAKHTGFFESFAVLAKKDSRTSLCILTGACFGIASANVIATGVSSFAVFSLDFSPQHTSILFIFFGFSFVFGIIVTAGMSSATARWQIIGFSTYGVATMTLITFFFATTKSSFIICLCCIGFLVAPLFIHYLPLLLDETVTIIRTGPLIGVFQIIGSIAAIVGPVVAGVFISSQGDNYKYLWLAAFFFLSLSTVSLTIGYYLHMQILYTNYKNDNQRAEAADKPSHFLFVYEARLAFYRLFR